jgi:hypothetical protein
MNLKTCLLEPSQSGRALPWLRDGEDGISIWRAAAIVLKRSGHWTALMLPAVLYGCETWSPTLREERRLRVFENRVLRRVFGPKRDEVTGEWRKVHNEELNDLYC